MMAESNGGISDHDAAMDVDPCPCDKADEDGPSGPSRKKQCNGQNRCEPDVPVKVDVEGSTSAATAANNSSKRRIKKDDSGISVEKDEEDLPPPTSEGVGGSVPRPAAAGDVTAYFKVEGVPAKGVLRFKMGNGDVASDRSSPDSGHHDGGFVAPDFSGDDDDGAARSAETGTETSADDREDGDEDDDDRTDEVHSRSDADMAKLSDDDSFSLKSDRAPLSSSDDDGGCGKAPARARPKHQWFLCPEVLTRQFGISSNVSSDLFRLRAYGSLHMVERLELMYKMKRHEGCVNTLHFNATGTRLVSGSDDLNVIVWDWAIGEPVLVYESGHRSNVFQAKFMPLGGDCHIVSCARDGQVRLAELSSTGICKGTRRVAHHRGPAHKLALEPDSPHSFMSCGEDGLVFEIDFRASKPERLLICKENDRKVPLYTIFTHPSNPYEFAIGGKDHFIRIYDKRRIDEGNGVLKKFCPHHMLNSDIRANVTCLVYNHDGSEILASYNDEDIYTFDTRHSDGAEYTRRYQGHRNSATVKGVNYFGPQSEFVISGSDCGHIYVWDRSTESVVQFMPGDEGGVVNCLEPHPHIPVLATSGLDDNIKIWVPSCEMAPKLTNLKAVMRTNRKERNDDRRREPETIDGQMLWFLMHHLRRSARRRARMEGQRVEEDTTSDDDTNSDEDEDSMPPPVQCETS